MPPKGHPAKKKRNVSGLKNQSAPAETPLPLIIESTGKNMDSQQGQDNDGELNSLPQDMASSEQETYCICHLMCLQVVLGWCKYHYCGVEKKTFQDAKDAAKEYLEACPTEVIQWFINRSWQFKYLWLMSGIECIPPWNGNSMGYQEAKASTGFPASNVVDWGCSQHILIWFPPSQTAKITLP